MGRWTIAVAAALAVFFVLWWAWYAFRWPPAGANRLAVALPVSAVVSAALSGPLFFWAGRQLGGRMRGCRWRRRRRAGWTGLSWPRCCRR
jgi:hypothetical protein